MLKTKISLLPYFFIKGCPNKCAFCCNSILPQWEGKPADKVKEDLEYLKKRYRINQFYFLNPTINPTPQYTKEIAKVLKDLGIKWSDSANFVPLNRKLLRLLQEAGSIRLIFGLESGSPRILRYINKNLTLTQVEGILKLCCEVGIWPEVNLICGFPHETEKDVKLTVSFLKKVRKYLRVVYVNKFFLEGRIKKYPEKFGIVIREDAFRPKEVLKEEWRGGFDEIGGLKWQEKVKLTNQWFDYYREECRKLEIEWGSETQAIFAFSSLPEWKEIVQGKIIPKVRPLIWS